MNLETVRELEKLYQRLQSVDSNLRAMTTKPVHGGTPLQMVTFYKCTSTSSGPHQYKPQHCAEAIAACVVADMKIERSLLATRIHNLGFETPEVPSGDGEKEQKGNVAGNAENATQMRSIG